MRGACPTELVEFFLWSSSNVDHWTQSFAIDNSVLFRSVRIRKSNSTINNGYCKTLLPQWLDVEKWHFRLLKHRRLPSSLSLLSRVRWTGMGAEGPGKIVVQFLTDSWPQAPDHFISPSRAGSEVYLIHLLIFTPRS